MSVDFDGTAGRLYYGDLRSVGEQLGNSYSYEYWSAHVKHDASGVAERIWYNETSSQGSAAVKLDTNAFRYSLVDSPYTNRHDTDTTFATGTWYRLYGQGKASGVDDIDIYRDGTLGTGSRVTGSSPANINTGTNGLTVGARTITGTADQWLNGEIAELAIWQGTNVIFFDNTPMIEAIDTHHFSPLFFLQGLRFYAPLMDADHDWDMISGTDPTQTATVSKGAGGSGVNPKIQNYLSLIHI